MTGSADDRFLLPAPSVESLLLPWLLAALKPMNRTRVKQLLRHGRVSINGTTVSRHDHPVRPGDKVGIVRAASLPHDRSLEEAGISILLEDDALIVIDKPAGLLTVATDTEKTDTAFARLLAHLTSRGLGRPFVVHRLDRETSGLLLFARTAAIRDQFQAHWDKVSKTYLAIVEGMPRPAEGVVENYLIEGRNLRVRAFARPCKGARRAVTRYRVVAADGRYTLVEVDLETGRKHQIRVHLAGLGCPIIGDPIYGSANNPVRRLGLHAHRLMFDHPLSGQRIEVESPLPTVLRKVVE